MRSIMRTFYNAVNTSTSEAFNAAKICYFIMLIISQVIAANDERNAVKISFSNINYHSFRQYEIIS